MPNRLARTHPARQPRHRGLSKIVATAPVFAFAASCVDRAYMVARHDRGLAPNSRAALRLWAPNPDRLGQVGPSAFLHIDTCPLLPAAALRGALAVQSVGGGQGA